ncbi:MAG: pyridoxamine 5'-phosphate oxidase family protein [Planctomycetes bacterium]|nr:pyridoxamine 5'-phosphate oxidase family protein [Planctomycetota bacterium]
MSLADYFDNVKGIGILGTADREGRVDLAIYARPHVLDEETVAFIMGDHLSHRNVAANPHAAYLFVVEAEGYNGLRLYLTKESEETDPQKIEGMRRKSRREEGHAARPSYLVYFKVDEVRRLVGSALEEAQQTVS